MSKRVYPYIPNSEPAIKEQMLKEVGIDSVEDIYAEIPKHLKFKGKLNLPEPFLSEYALKRHVEGILAKNKTCKDHLNFLGGGTWQHYVPEVCNTIISRDEFLTAYGSDYYADHGKGQAFFEYASMLGDLLEMDVVSLPTYDWAAAAGNSIRMASRITGRNKVLIPKTISPDRLSCIKNYCEPGIEIELVSYDEKTGYLDLGDLKNRISAGTAAVYFENPSYLGFIEMQGEDISKIAHDHGAVCIVGVDPVSLGVLEVPDRYGADIVCGELQPLGINMYSGGGLGGFIATREEEKYVAEYPSILVTLTSTKAEGEYGFGGFGSFLFDRTSYVQREKAKDFVGTECGLWTIAAGVYLALMGPQGIKELAENVVQKAHYMAGRLSEIKGVKAPVFNSPNFKEFIVNFDETDKKVKDINKKLLDFKIFGGKDLSREFPELGESALYCVTEVHTHEDLEKFFSALQEAIK